MLTRVLQDLEACGFVRRYGCVGAQRGRAIYQLIDNYTLFYFKFLHNARAVSSNFWSATVNTPGRNAWQGLAFERVCLHHIPQIKNKLGITGVLTNAYSWTTKAIIDTDGGEWPGAQIDLLLERADNVINVCEMKYSNHPFTITEDYDKRLRERIATFRHHTKCKSALHLTFVTTFGLVRNKYCGNVQSEVVMDDLFVCP